MQQRRILVAVSGGIAAYKVPELVREFVRAGHAVRCVLTPEAERFVTPLVLQTLTGFPARSQLFDLSEEGEIDHIALADWAELLVVAPATAHLLARLAHGRLYDCADGKRLAVGALEPKFWAKLVELLGLPELSGAGLDPGPAGRQAAQQVQQALAAQPRDHWLALFKNRGLPITPVVDMTDAGQELQSSGLMEQTPAPGAEPLSTPGPFLPSLGVTPAQRAPDLGEHTSAILAEFGLTE